MNVLITGGNGLLGQRLIFELLFNGFNVYSLVRDYPKVKVDGLNYLICDLSQPFNLAKLSIKVNVIVHLAQSNQYRNFPSGSLDVFNVNLASTAYLLEYGRSAGIDHFIFASSGGVYSAGKQALSENCDLKNINNLGYYLGSKVSSEILVGSFKDYFKVSIIRPFFMYGKGQNRWMLLPRLFDTIVSGSEVILNTENGISINPIHVDDAAKAVFRIIERDESSIYNLAGSQILTLRKICNAIGKYTSKSPFFIVKNLPADDLIADISLMKTNLLRPEKDLTQHICDLAI